MIPPFARYVAIVASLRWEPAAKPNSPPPGLPQLGTYCRHGHEWTPENTAIGKDGKRDCRQCARRRAKETYWRERERRMTTTNHRETT